MTGEAEEFSPLLERLRDRQQALRAVATQSDDAQETGDDAPGGGRKGTTTAVHLQRELAALRDRTRMRELEAELENQGNWPQLDRVRELRNAEVSHK